MAKNIGTCLFEMQKEDIMTDVTLIVHGTEMKAHRNVVASRGGPLRKLMENRDDRVEISDEVSLRAFTLVLEYLYTDGCAIDYDNVYEVLYAAKIFHLEGLSDLCVIKLKPHLTKENIGSHTAQAQQFDVKQYLQICKDYFGANTLIVLYTKEFLGFSNAVLTELISAEEINCSDLELFRACLEWAENTCSRKNQEPTAANIRTVLGDVLKGIRFSKMSQDDFLNIVVPMEILSGEKVVQTIISWQTESKMKEMPAKFSDRIKKTEVKVTVQTYAAMVMGRHKEASVALDLPLSTRISQMKAMKIFEGGTRQCPSDKFTLEHKGKELADDTTLASIYSPGEDFTLKLHSLTFPIKERNVALEFPLTFTLEEYKSRCDEIVEERVQRLEGIQPYRVVVENNYWPYPGGTIYIQLH